MGFRVDQLDHVELTVPDRLEAARWYSRVLGLEIIEEFRFWAENPNGPLMIGSKDAQTKLALFEGEPIGSKRNVGFHLTAFRVSGDGFLEFLSLLKSLRLTDSNDRIVKSEHVADHQRAFSIYFCDPWRNDLELTTYDHAAVRTSLAQD